MLIKTILRTKRGALGATLALLSFLLAACSDEPLHTSLAGATATPPRVNVNQPSNSQRPPVSTPSANQTPLAGRAPGAAEFSVQASVETEPVASADDAADDIAIWYNPRNPGESRVIGTDKEGGGLLVYALDGRLIQSIPGDHNNVDLRTGFRLGNETITLVISSERRTRTAAAFKMSDDGQLSPLSATGNSSQTDIYGTCMYRSPEGRYYAFLTQDDDGLIQQYEITANSNGDGVTMNIVRTFDVGSQSEGCAADDVHQRLYIAEETRGLWRYGANPGDGDSRVMVDTTGAGGNLEEDVEGVAIYYAGNDAGYVLVSSQGNDLFAVYDRQTNAYLGAFRIVDGAIDGVTGTDGIDVANAGLGAAFPNGVFVVQDGNNRDATTRRNQNFKMVPWQAIAGLFNPPLSIDTSRTP